MNEAMKNLTVLRPLLRGLPIIIVVLICSLLAVSRYLHYATPMYESTAKIKLAGSNDGPSSANLFKDFDIFTTSNKIGAEVEVLKSKLLVGRALDSLDFGTTLYRLGNVRKTELYEEAPFNVKITIRDPHWYERPFSLHVISQDSIYISLPDGREVPAVFGRPLLLDEADILLEKDTAFLLSKKHVDLVDHYECEVHEKENLINQVVSKMDVTPVDKDVPIIRINYQSAVPKKAADFVNRLAQTYIEDYIANKYITANTTVKFLNKQLEDIGGKLAGSENAIEQYRNAEHITNIRQETETDLRHIAELKVELANLEMNLAAIDNLNRYIQQGRTRFLELAPNFEAFSDLLSTELIKQIEKLQADKKDLLLRYTDKDERVKAIDEKINNLADYIVESIGNSRKNYEIKYRHIDSTIKAAERVFVNLPEKEKKMTIMERDFDLNEKIYNFLHQKRTEAEIARAANLSFHRIIEAGEIPVKPFFPNKALITGLAVMLGLFGSIGIIYLVHSIKAKVNDEATIEKNTTLPLVAAVPYLAGNDKRTGWFNDCAIQLDIRRLVSYPVVISINSFNQLEGRTFLAKNLARAYTALGKKVLLIDTSNAPGNSATVNGLLTVEPATGHMHNGVVIKSVVEEKIRQARQQYDVTIINNQPCGQSANPLVYMALAGLNLFVLDARNTPARSILKTQLLQEQYLIPEMKLVLNRAGYNPGMLTVAGNFINRLFNRPFNKK